MLPGVDDGAPDLKTALAMARTAAADGITVTACTPHILPGVYNNSGPQICAWIEKFQAQVDAARIPLRLVQGADIHLVTDLLDGLRCGRLPVLGQSRYFLLEPPHNVAPPRFEETVFSIVTAGYVPVITHPERLRWVESHFAVLERLNRAGVWIQLTAGSITGRFGTRARFWCERMLDEGMVQIVATDAHDLRSRPPVLSRARDAVAERLGEQEANNMVFHRPAGVLQNADPACLVSEVQVSHARSRPTPARARFPTFLRRAFGDMLSGASRG